ncbi:hypothetical protein ACFL6P_05815 [Candidatus Latescibacterota bacterium]
MKRYNLLLIFFLFSLNVNAQTATDYYPLSVGSMWITKYIHTGCNAEPSSMSKQRIDFIGEDGLIGMKSSSEAQSDFPASCGWYKKDMNGDVFFCKTGVYPNPTIVKFKFDVPMVIMEWNPPILIIDASEMKKGGSWEYQDEQFRTVSPDSTVKVTITNTSIVDSVNETVTVPAGTFTNCIKVRGTAITSLGDTTGVSTSFYAPGVGRVLCIDDNPEDQASRAELIEYVIK